MTPSYRWRGFRDEKLSELDMASDRQIHESDVLGSGLQLLFPSRRMNKTYFNDSGKYKTHNIYSV